MRVSSVCPLLLLLNKQFKGVGAAMDLEDAAKQFKGNGKTVLELSKATTKYGAGLKYLGTASKVATVLEETAYVVGAPEGKKLQALGASATNVVGDTGATAGGVSGGAALGLLTGPAAPVAVPLFAVIGGFGGHKAWDKLAKPFYRELWTGIPEPKE